MTIEIQLRYIDYDALVSQFIREDLRIGEQDLYETKWWDYKPLHVLESTYLFVDSYKSAIKEAIKRRKCLYRGNNYKGLKHDDFLECSTRTITGMWKARKTADTYGIPYDVYCNQAMLYAEKNDYKYLPNPSQLYSNKPKKKGGMSMLQHIVQHWNEISSNRLFYARSKFYSVDAFKNNRYQILHQRHLLKAVREKISLRHVLVAELVYEKRLLSAKAVRQHFDDGDSLLNQAKNFLDL